MSFGFYPREKTKGKGSFVAKLFRQIGPVSFSCPALMPQVLRGGQEIPRLFGDMKAVLANPASYCVDRLRPSGDGPEQATKFTDEFATGIAVDQRPPSRA